MHSSEQAKRYYRKNWKIHERCLIPNATHVQQPVDQHIGNYIGKHVMNKYWKYGESLLDEIDAGTRDETDKIGLAEMRGKICEWTNEAVIKARKERDLLRHAWINFGLYLPMDGSKDGDIDTIVK